VSRHRFGGATSAEQLQLNLGAADVDLEAEDLAVVDAASKPHRTQEVR